MPDIGNTLQVLGTIIALLTAVGSWLKVRQEASKTRAEATQIIEHTAGELINKMQNRMTEMEAELSEKKRMIEVLEEKISKLEQEMAGVKRERAKLQRRQAELERGVRILIEQIRCLGHEPQYILSEDE